MGLADKPPLKPSSTPAGKPAGTPPAWAFPAAILFVLAATAFYPVLHHGFINLDDPAYVVLNPHVHQGLTWDSIRWAFTTFDTANWHPLTWLSHLLDYQIFGQRVWGHHLSNLVLHGLNALALFLLLRTMTGTLWRSFFVAAFFAVHPLRVESVAWVAERKDVLSTFFFLLTLFAYVRYVQVKSQGLKSDGQSPKSKVGSGKPLFLLSPGCPLFYWLAVFLFVLGLMSKPMLVTLPFVLLLLDFWPLQRPGFKNSAGRFQFPFQRLWEKTPFFLLALASCVVTMLAQRAGGIVVTTGGTALLDRVENAAISYCRYLGKLFWPSDLAVFYPQPASWPAWESLSAAVFLLGITAWALWMWRRAPYLAVGWGWFLGTLVPVIGLVQVGWQAMADRYSYIPSIGILLMWVWGAWAAAQKVSSTKMADNRATGTFLMGAGGCGLLLGCLLLTHRQLAYWQDSESLFRHTLAVTKDNAFTHDLLGLALRIEGRLDESNAELREAIRINPHYAGACRDLGHTLVLQHKLDEGIPLLEKALQLAPQLPRTHKQLGNAFQAQGRLHQALVQFQEELKISPQDAEAHNELGATLLGLERVNEAVPEFHAALQLDPGYPEAYSNLGIALCRQGQLTQGIAEFEQALRLRPVYAEAHNNLAVALARAGRREEAISHFKEALRIRPNYPGAEQQLRALSNAP